MSGQITLNSSFGYQLRSLAADPKYKTFLDVGTWNGQGTTLCLFAATKDRQDVMIYSVEANQEMYHTACAYWSPCPSSLKLIHGTLSRKMLSNDEITKHPIFRAIEAHYDLHYVQDCIDLMSAPLAVLPQQIDFIVLDGGEFNGLSDFEMALTLNPKVIALDDINVMKNEIAHQRLSSNPAWQLHAMGKDRNGWSIFVRD